MRERLLLPSQEALQRPQSVFWRGLLFIFLTLSAGFVAAEPLKCDHVFQESPQDYILKTFSPGSKDFRLSKDFATSLMKLPPTEKEAWITSIGATYRKVPKKNPNPTAAWHIGGRRLLDYSLVLLERPDQVFAAGIAKNKSPETLYSEFMQRQNQLFKSAYTAKDILEFVRFVKAEIGPLQNAMGRPLKVLLGGSFINGKAQISTSDLDVSISEPALVHRMSVWEKRLNEILWRHHPEAALKIETHIEPAAFYGKINPFVISIEARRASILVFEPARPGVRPSELDAASYQHYDLF